MSQNKGGGPPRAVPQVIRLNIALPLSDLNLSDKSKAPIPLAAEQFLLALVLPYGIGPDEPHPFHTDALGNLETRSRDMVYVQGRAAWFPKTGYVHPYHPETAVQEISWPQELVASSHPAAGSTASVTITNPGTNFQSVVAITQLSAALASAVASAGQANNVTITGSIGGQYTAEAVVLPAAAFSVDRVIWGDRVFCSGNGSPANALENFTITYGAVGIANVFQQINVWYRLGS